MKKLFAALILSLFCVSGVSAQCPNKKPGCSDWDGDMNVTGDVEIDGNVGIGVAPSADSALKITADDDDVSITAVSTVTDGTTLATNHLTLAHDSTASSQNMQNIKGFMVLQGLGANTADFMNFQAQSTFNYPNTDTEVISYADIVGFGAQFTNTAMWANKTITITEYDAYKSYGLNNMSVAVDNAVTFSSINHMHAYDSTTNIVRGTLNITRQIGLLIDDMTAGLFNGGIDYGIVLEDGADGIFFDGVNGANITGDDGEIVVADRSTLHTESLSNTGNFSANWGVTGGWAVDATDATFTGTSATGNLTQVEANQNKTPGTENAMYAFTYTISGADDVDSGMTATITTGYASYAISLPILVNRTYTVYFMSNTNPTDFIIAVAGADTAATNDGNCTAASAPYPCCTGSGTGTCVDDTFSIDDVSLKQIISGSIVVHDSLYIRSDGDGCIMMRDTDDAGWTECFTLNGVMSCTTDADGVCDGA
jgi:hypothetical protein